jgi:hypothetical protein
MGHAPAVEAYTYLHILCHLVGWNMRVYPVFRQRIPRCENLTYYILNSFLKRWIQYVKNKEMGGVEIILSFVITLFAFSRVPLIINWWWANHFTFCREKSCYCLYALSMCARLSGSSALAYREPVELCKSTGCVHIPKYQWLIFLSFCTVNKGITAPGDADSVQFCERGFMDAFDSCNDTSD